MKARKRRPASKFCWRNKPPNDCNHCKDSGMLPLKLFSLSASKLEFVSPSGRARAKQKRSLPLPSIQTFARPVRATYRLWKPKLSPKHAIRWTWGSGDVQEDWLGGILNGYWSMCLFLNPISWVVPNPFSSLITRPKFTFGPIRKVSKTDF